MTAKETWLYVPEGRGSRHAFAETEWIIYARGMKKFAHVTHVTCREIAYVHKKKEYKMAGTIDWQCKTCQAVVPESVRTTALLLISDENMEYVK